jgi:hypothetical protein
MSYARNGNGWRATGLACLVVAGAAAYAGAARAQEALIPPGTETFKINLGGILTTNSTSFRLDGTTGRGTDVDLEDIAGLKSDTSSILASGTWRFLPRHRIGITAFQVERDKTRNIDRTITIGDTVIPVNTNLKSEAKSQFFISNYQYSFVKDEHMEFAAVLGLYGANLKYKFTAVAPVVDIDRSTTAPLPVLGLSADFYLNPRWTVSVLGEGLKLKVGDVDGSMYYLGISTDYMFTRNWGVGVGYQLADIKVDLTKGDFRGHIGWRMDGYIAYVQARF